MIQSMKLILQKIPFLLQKKEETMSKPRQHKREWNDLQACVKYYKIYHTKKQTLKTKEK